MTGRGLATRLRRIAPLLTMVRTIRALATAQGRGLRRAQARGARLFQPATVTWMDRHPALFAQIAEHLAAHPAPRLLSFGCSTGEEAFTLADYLPHATIDAIDVNPACIAEARRTAKRSEGTGAARIRFACADAPGALAHGGYDAVLCLSVLRHGDLDSAMPASCTAILPFARFAAAIEALDRLLRPGGLLVLWGCNFRFADTPVAARYQSVATPHMSPQYGLFYGPDDRSLPDVPYAEFVFVKLA